MNIICTFLNVIIKSKLPRIHDHNTPKLAMRNSNVRLVVLPLD